MATGHAFCFSDFRKQCIRKLELQLAIIRTIYEYS